MWLTQVENIYRVSVFIWSHNADREIRNDSRWQLTLAVLQQYTVVQGPLVKSTPGFWVKSCSCPRRSLFHSSISYVTRYGETIFKKEHLTLVINFQNDIWIKIKKNPKKHFLNFTLLWYISKLLIGIVIILELV